MLVLIALGLSAPFVSGFRVRTTSTKEVHAGVTAEDKKKQRGTI